MTETYTGGCQCGAIRFRVSGELKDSSICHCRMCQKAFGAYYAPLVSVRGADFEWTRGARKTFRSSNFVLRGFCGDCGTPLTYEAPDGMAIAAGAFDDPSQLPPTIQWGVEGKIGFVDHLHELPGERTEADLTAGSFLHGLISYQHPDHDTPVWPPEDRT
ncbi:MULTISPECIES: GFA family protein [Rhizobium]|uniref:GFA family protein n=1 Tax=Rhizobium TaxID=379 RepID=UPI0007E9F5D1|nr:MULTISPECIES: GFA family protein [Rhizobium]ANK90981.1 GFA family glutathione-dependent formaldehyde-activating protein [Rhizobium sp. N6212]ANK97010.1 GFA family glutathione-dependent formaldehyde-activating protein [Rhizobium sp. N621]ANL03130.1 GFA family glutathione-dependent formaldehyde-activating protein [Rhizobium esperanzae]ANL09179.1 GFA family glutathione-dependent formaldehyde-activating protein [Rhizobium sp. N1341]ANL21225.1 GFA family glutathione-dependent formaldehyde-activa